MTWRSKLFWRWESCQMKMESCMCGESFQRSAQSSKLGKQNHHHPCTRNRTLMVVLFVFSYLAFNQPRTLTKAPHQRQGKRWKKQMPKRKILLFKTSMKRVCINYFVIYKVIKSYFWHIVDCIIVQVWEVVLFLWQCNAYFFGNVQSAIILLLLIFFEYIFVCFVFVSGDCGELGPTTNCSPAS